jgi:phospholipid/cholesterol/gamma-HCH transport system substrate-binding protein
MLSQGDTLKSAVPASLVDQIKGGAQPLLNNLDSITYKINSTLNAETQKSMQASVKALQTNMEILKLILTDNKGNISGIMGNANTTTDKLNTEVLPQIKSLLVSLNSTSDSLKNSEIKQMIASSTKTVNEIQSLARNINSDQGTLGTLMHDKKLYNNLNKTLADLDSILVDFKDNPRHYLRPLGAKKKKKK